MFTGVCSAGFIKELFSLFSIQDFYRNKIRCVDLFNRTGKLPVRASVKSAGVFIYHIFFATKSHSSRYRTDVIFSTMALSLCVDLNVLMLSRTAILLFPAAPWLDAIIDREYINKSPS